MDKSAARQAAFARRKAAHRPGMDNAGFLMQALQPYKGRVTAGYMAMRSEIDPMPAMIRAAEHGMVGVPVITGPRKPLRFRAWAPHANMVKGDFGALIPATGAWIEPDVVIVPLVAFDRSGGRLGYGGGFYDRTLDALRAKKPVIAIGFAYAAQEAVDLPLEPTDQPLDLIVTETGIIAP